MHGCTITTSHYLAHARVMAESFLAHNPGAGFSVLVIEDAPSGRLGEEAFAVLTPADIGIDEQELSRRATMYLTQGLAVSMKPDLLLALLDRGHETVLFLDSDSCVYTDLTDLAECARSYSLVLSPHCLDPYPLWKVNSPEQIFIRAGVMNAGLLGVSAGARPFLRWWAQRTARRCVFDEERGLFLEQTWLMLAPALFEHHVLRDRGCNVAGWNLHTRDVQWQGDVPGIDGGPLRHFHFAMSYDPEHPERLTASEHADWWPTLQERPGVARLSCEYAERLLAHGYREARVAPPLFDKMPGGAPIEPWMRANYRAALLDADEDGTAEPPNPFVHGEASFLRWLQPRALARVASQSAASSQAAGTDPAADLDRAAPRDLSAAPEDPFSAEELAAAMLDTAKLLARIRELEGIRDDAIGWAERSVSELGQAERTLAERDASLGELEGRRAQLAVEVAHLGDVIEDIKHSPSWRITRPLRAAKTLATRITRAR